MPRSPPRRDRPLRLVLGSNYYGQLGFNAFDDRRTPERVGTYDWKAVAAGGRHTCAVRADDALFCWGDSDERSARHARSVEQTVRAGGRPDIVIPGPAEAW